ncbi:hypothetical protein D3C85_1767470 [compost metagenome]
MYLIIEVLDIKNKRKKALTLGLIFVAIIVISRTPYSDILFLELLTNYLLPGILWGMLIFSLVVVGLVNWAHLRRKLKP